MKIEQIAVIILCYFMLLVPIVFMFGMNLLFLPIPALILIGMYLFSCWFEYGFTFKYWIPEWWEKLRGKRSIGE